MVEDRPLHRCLGVFLWLCTTAVPGIAGEIGITSRISASVEDGALMVVTHVTNTGSEAATSVVTSARFARQEFRGKGLESLSPGASTQSSFRVPLTSGTRGQWPLISTVDYTDTNGYPFQALQVAQVSLPGATPSLVLPLDFAASPVAGVGSIRIRLKNLSDAARQAQVRFYVARGLEVTPTTQPVTLDSWGETEVEAEVVNRTALTGSRYPVFATIEYDEADAHHTAIIHGVVEVRDAARGRAGYAFAAAVALALTWIAALLVRRRRGKPLPAS